MAAVHAPSEGRITALNVPKLRETCHACACSKLRCSKEKPACSRCAKRGFTCTYVTAKRSGRKSNSLSSINRNRDHDVSNIATCAKDNKLFPSQADCFAPSSSNPSTNSLHWLGVEHHSPQANATGPADVLQPFSVQRVRRCLRHLQGRERTPTPFLPRLYHFAWKCPISTSSVRQITSPWVSIAAAVAPKVFPMPFPPCSRTSFLSSGLFPLPILHHNIPPTPTKRCTTTNTSARRTRHAHVSWAHERALRRSLERMPDPGQPES